MNSFIYVLISKCILFYYTANGTQLALMKSSNKCKLSFLSGPHVLYPYQTASRVFMLNKWKSQFTVSLVFRTGLGKSWRSFFLHCLCLRWRIVRMMLPQRVPMRICVWSWNARWRTRMPSLLENANQDAKTSTGRDSLLAEALSHPSRNSLSDCMWGDRFDCMLINMK